MDDSDSPTSGKRPARHAKRRKPGRADTGTRRQHDPPAPQPAADVAGAAPLPDALGRANRALRALSECGQLLVSVRNENALLTELCHVIVDTCGYKLAWVGFAERDEQQTVRPVAQAGFEQGYLDKAGLTWADTKRGQGPTGTAIRTGRRTTCQDMQQDPRFAPWRKEALRRGYASSIALPLIASGQPIGALNIYAAEPHAFDSEEAHLLTQLAEMLSHGIESLRAGRSLAASEEQYRLLVENSLDGVLLTAPDGRIFAANPSACAMFGRTEAEICRLGRNGVVDLTDSRLKDALSERARVGRFRCELTLVRADGARFPAEVSSVVFTDGNGEPRTSMVIRDLSEQKQAEQALREHEERFRRTVETAHEGIWMLDAECRTTFANRRLAEMLGRDVKDILGRPTEDFMFPEDVAAHAARMEQRTRGESAAYELRLRRADGGECWAMVSASPVTDSEGRYAGSFAMLTDISERRRAAEALRASEMRYRGLFENIGTCVAVYEARDDGGDFVIKDFNRAAETLEKVKREDIVGRSVTDVFPGVREFGLLDVFRRVWQTGAPEHHPVSLYKDDRIAGWRENHVYKLPSGEVVAVYEDVTERKQAEAALHAASRELERHRYRLQELVEERTEELRAAQGRLVMQEKLAAVGRVAGSVAHELRNPLGAAKNASYFVQKAAADRLAGKPLRHLQLIDESIDQANRAITAILDFTWRQQGEPKVCSLRPLLERAVAEATIHASVNVHLDAAHGLPRVLVDDKQIVVVFRNLFTNAAQAMPDGGVIRVTARPQAGELAIDVADTGCGIKPEHLDRVFQPLFTTKPIGIGLGLAICREFVEANKGTIAVKSEVGKGATFTVVLPLAERQTPNPKP